MDAKRFKPYLKLLASPAVVVLLLSLALILFNLLLVHNSRPYNSDDVSWQNILLTWRPFNGHKAFLGGSDNFIIKAPMFALFGHFFAPSRKLLFLESGIFAMATFTLFYLSALYFLKKLKIRLNYVNLLPFLWLASFGYFMARLYLNPILRNFELGLSFVTFVLFAKLYYREINPLGSWLAKSLSLLVCVLGGILIYNDPYFLYFTIGPIVIFSIVLYALGKLDRARLATVLGMSFISLILAKLFSHLVLKAGALLLFREPAQFVSFTALTSNVMLALHGTLRLFGADFFGQPAGSLTAVAALANFAILAYLAYRIWKLKQVEWRNKNELSPLLLWTAFFGLLNIFVLLVYTFSNLAVDIETYRYLIMIAFSSVLLLAIIIGTMAKGRLVVAGLVAAAIVFNLAATVVNNSSSSLQPGALGNRANELNFQIINALQAYHQTKGYAPYWDGNINSYLSGGTIAFLPISCFGGDKTQVIQFLVDQGQINRPAARSFYILDPDLNNPATCTPDQVLNQFGQPAQTLKLFDKTIWLYDYDIMSRM